MTGIRTPVARVIAQFIRSLSVSPPPPPCVGSVVGVCDSDGRRDGDGDGNGDSDSSGERLVKQGWGSPA